MPPQSDSTVKAVLSLERFCPILSMAPVLAIRGWWRGLSLKKEMARPRWRDCAISLPGPRQIEFINGEDNVKLTKQQKQHKQQRKADRRSEPAGWHSMNRKQRREMMRKIQAEDLSLQMVHPDAAGIDIGNESHYVAVPPGRDSAPLRCFGCSTAELRQMADWLKQCGIRTVALQSTGVYWIAI